MLSCQRCRGTSNGPQAFLLTCRGCSRTWHHRCHMPPVEDEDLIRRIRATNGGDTANGLGAWACRRCKKGTSKASSTMSSREPTVSSDAHEDSGRLNSSRGPDVANASIGATVDVRVRQESSDARLAYGRERHDKSDRRELREAAPAKQTLAAKSTRPSAAYQPYVQPQPGPAQSRDTDVQMASITPSTEFTLQEKRHPQRSFSPTPSHHDRDIRQYVSTVSAMSSEEDVEMGVESVPPTSIEPTSRATSRASRASSSDNQVTRRKPVADVPAVSLTTEREREVRPADGMAVQPQVAANEIDDDPDDLYGPPVEHKVIRILPALAEDLRGQQRQAAAQKVAAAQKIATVQKIAAVQKEKPRRAPLAPDWILARHAHDPMWKEIPTEGRRGRKAIARRLADNGLNVDELMNCWVRHKT